MNTPSPAKPPVVAAKAKPADDKPSVKNPGAFFLGKEVTIYAPEGHLITKAYCTDVKPGETGVFGPVTLLDASFADDGTPRWAFIRYREKNSRKYMFMDLIPLEGCSLSVSIVRSEEEELN